MEFGAIKIILLVMCLGCLNAQPDCNIDKFFRTSCPVGSEASSESVCRDRGCCWDSTWSNLPHCFLAAGPTTTTEASDKVTSSAGATLSTVMCLGCLNAQPATTTTEASDKVTSSAGATSSTGVTSEATSGGSTIVAQFTTSVQTTSIPINDLIDEILEKQNAKADDLVGLLNPGLSENELTRILAAATRVSDASGNQTNDQISQWTALFNKVLEVLGSNPTRAAAENFLNTSSNVLHNELLRHNTTVNQSHAIDVINSLEKYAVAMTTAVLEEKQSLVISMEHNNFTFCNVTTTLSNCDLISDYVTASVDTNVTGDLYLTYVTYKFKSDSFLAGGQFGNSPASLGTPVYSVATHSGGFGVNRVKVEMSFKLLSSDEDNGSAKPVCAFVDAASGDWSSDGCTVTSHTASSARCSCNHNTSFAILFLHSDLKLSAEEESIFEIITFIGCGTSITALLLTIFTFVYLKLTRVKRIVLHLNLTICLCLGQIVLLIGTNASTGTVYCKVTAVLLHFLFLASFSWMLMEGVLLYFQSVRAVSGQVNFNLVLTFGWILPLIIVGISLGVGFGGYGNDKGCWLSINNGLIWAFIGPALGFVAINLILLILIVQVFLKLKTNSKSGEWERAKRTIRAIAVLTPLLGITWIFGVLAVNDATKWFLYLFSVFNSLQGLFIFIFHCLRNEDVRKSFMKRYRKSVKNMGPFFSAVTPSSGNSTSTFVRNTSNFASSPRMPQKSSW